MDILINLPTLTVLVLVCDLNRPTTEKMFIVFYPPCPYSSVTFSLHVSSYISLKGKLKIIQQLAFTSNLNEMYLKFVHVPLVYSERSTQYKLNT